MENPKEDAPPHSRTLIFGNDLDVEFLTVTELLSRDGTPPTPGNTYYNG